MCLWGVLWGAHLGATCPFGAFMSRFLAVASLLALGCGTKKTPEPDATTVPPIPEAPTMADADSDGDSESDTEAAEVPLDASLELLNTRWELRSFDGEAVEMVPDSRPLFFRVDHGAPPDVSGFGGCNRFYGTAFTATSTTVAFGAVGLTRMACPNLSAEQMFISTLAKADTWTVDGDTLTLMAGTESTLVFERTADQAASDDAPAAP